MRVTLKALKPNPLRDFVVDPVDKATVAALRASIREDGFWGGVVCAEIQYHLRNPNPAIREMKSGGLFVIAGWHRILAAIAEGETSADLYVIKNPSDEQVLRIYARENATQRGEDSPAQAGSVASALKIAARTCSRGTPSSSHGGAHRTDVGAPAIEKLLKGIASTETVKEQLANLKASGDYARILDEVAAELGDAADDKLKKEVVRAKAKPKTFDYQGVAAVLKTPDRVKAFRNIVTGQNMQRTLPVERQAELAKALVDKAAETEREVSGRYLRDEAVGMMLDTKAISRQLDTAERAEMERNDWEARAKNLMSDVARATRSIVTNMQALVKHCQSRPKGAMLYQAGDFSDAMDNLEHIIKMKGKLK